MTDSVIYSSDFVPDFDRMDLSRCFCGPCEVKKKKQVLALWYCIDCEDYFCGDCKDWHSAMKISKAHKVDRIRPATSPKHGICSKHCGEPILYFCADHGDKCCGKCLRDHHRSCPDTTSLEKPKRPRLVKEFDASFPGESNTPWITGAAFLPDSKLLLVDGENKRLKVFGPNFDIEFAKSFGEVPSCVAVYDSNEVCITKVHEGTVERFSISKPITKVGSFSAMTAECSKSCRGCDYMDANKIILTIQNENCLKIFTTSGKQITTISNEDVQSLMQEPTCCKVDRSKKTVYVGCKESANVCAIDIASKELLFHLANSSLSTPFGLDLDRDGNIYVCGCSPNAIHKISPEGISLGNILTAQDGIKQPVTIAFNPDGQTFVVAFLKNPTVRVYKL